MSPSHATGPSYPSGAGTPASPCSSAISSARTTRRGLRRSICRGARRGEPAQPVDERLEAVRCELRLEPCPHLGVARQRVGVEPARDGAQVQPGSADEDGNAVPLADPGQGRTRVADEVGHGERLVRVDEVEAVMGDAGALGGRHLRGPDVQAAEDLPRVGRDDLGGRPLPRDPLGEPDREPGLAGRGRTGDDEEGRRGGRHALTSVPPQGIRPGVVDAHDGEPPDEVGLAAQVDELVATCAAGQGRAVSIALGHRVGAVFVVVAARRNHRVDEHLDLAPEPGAIALEPDRLLEREQLVEAARFSAGGTSSASFVAGVPGRTEYAAANTWS